MSVLGYLRILRRSGEDGSRFPVKGSCRIGRSSTCDVRIMLPDVAPVHCIITGDEHGQCLVRNISPMKRTLVNGVPIAKNPVDLAHYDLITLADRTLRWEYLPNSPFYVMRAEGVHMSHLGCKAISGRMVTVPLSALQKSPTAHLTTPKNARGRKSGVTPSRNPITPLSSRKSNALVAVVSPTRRNQEIRSPLSMEPELPELKPQPKKRVSLPAKKTFTPLNSNNRRTLHGMPTVTTKSTPRRLHMIKSDVSPLDHPTAGDEKLKHVEIISKPTSTPLRKKTGARKSVPVKRLTPRPVARKSMPVHIVGLPHNSSKKRSSTSSPSDQKRESSGVYSPKKSLKSTLAKDLKRTPGSSKVTPKQSLKSTVAKDLKRTPRSSKVTAQKESKTLIPRLVSSTAKRKFEADLISAERAAKRMKMVKSPKSPDKKKMAAILQCHGKSPHSAIKIRKPLFSEVLKTNIARKKVPTYKNMGRSRPALNKKKPVTTSLKLTTVVPKSFRFNSTGHADSPETIVIRKGNQLPITTTFKSPLSAARKSPLSPKANSPSIPSDPLPSTSGLRSSFTTTPILKKKSLASVDILTSGTPSRKSVHFSTTHLTSEATKSPRKGRLSLIEKSLSFDYGAQDKEVPSHDTRPSINTPLELIEERKQFQDSENELAPKQTSRKSGARRSLALLEKQRGFSPVSSTGNSVTPKMDVTEKYIIRRSSGRKSIVGAPSPARKRTPERRLDFVEEDRSANRRRSRSEIQASSDSESCDERIHRKSGVRKSLVLSTEARQELPAAETIALSNSETPTKQKSRRSGARKSLIPPGEPSSAPSPVETTISDSETSDKITSRRSATRKSIVTAVEPSSSESSDSKTPKKMSRRSGARESIVTPIRRVSAHSSVEITSDSETPDKMSRRLVTRKSLLTPVEPVSAQSPFEITSDSETPNKISRRSGARKSIVVPVQPLSARSSVEITSASETPDKITSRRSGARKSLIAPPESLCVTSPVEKISSDPETPNKMSRRSGAKKSIASLAEPLSTLSPVDKTPSDSDTPSKLSRSGARKSMVTPVESSSVERVTYSENLNKITSRRSSARKSLVPPTEQRLGFMPEAALTDSETPEKIIPRRSGARKSLVVPAEQRHSLSAPSDSETTEKMQSRRSGAKKDLAGLSSSDSESPQTSHYRCSGARRSFANRVDASVENMTVLGADTPNQRLSRRSLANKSIIEPVESCAASDTESQEVVLSRSSSRQSTKSSPIQELGDFTDSAPSSGKHSMSGKSLRSSIHLKVGELNNLSSPKSSGKRLSRRSSLLLKNGKISTPMKFASKSISPLIRSGKLQQENGFISQSSSIRCEASANSVLGISLTESELSLLVSPKSSTSSPRRGRKRSMDMLLDEEGFLSGKPLSTSLNSISAVSDGSVTSFDFSAVKTPSFEKEFYVSPLSTTSNTDRWTSPRKTLTGGQRLSKASLRRSSTKGGLPHVHGVQRLLKTPRPQRSPKNDLSDVRGVKKLLGSPRVRLSLKNDLSDVRGVKKLLGSPRVQRSPKNDLSDVRGVKKLLGSPRVRRSPKNDLSDVRGVKKLLGSPRVRRSPKNDLSDVRGVKKLLGSPRLRRSPKNDLSDVRGVKKLLGSPRVQRSPKNDLSDVRGVKKLLGSPRVQRSPKNDLSDVRGVKKLLGSPRVQRSPRNDLIDVRGVKKLLGSPRVQRSPRNDLSDVRGVKKLLGSPRVQRSPRNDLSDVRGVKKLLGSPRLRLLPKNDLTRVEGVQELFKISSVSHTSRSTSSDSLDVTGLKQLFNSSPKSSYENVPDINSLFAVSSSASVENSSEISGTRKRAIGAETRPDSRIVVERESSVKAASATKTKKGPSKTPTNTKSQSHIALIDAVGTEEITIPEVTEVVSPVKTRRVKATANVIQLTNPKGEGTLDVEDSSVALVLRTRRAVRGKREVQTEMTSPRKTRGKAAAKEANTTKLIADQEYLTNSGKVNAETINPSKQQVSEITSTRKKQGGKAFKPEDQADEESMPKTRLRRAAANRVDTEASKISTPKSPILKRQEEITAEPESPAVRESTSEQPDKKRQREPVVKREVQVASRTVSKSQEGKIRGRMAGKLESLAADEPVLDTIGNMTKEKDVANNIQISGKSIPRSPDRKRKKGTAMKLESQVTEELVPHTPTRRKRGRMGANQDTENVVPGTPNQKRKGRAALRFDKSQEANRSLSKSPELRKHGKAVMNLESESTGGSTSNSRGRGRTAAKPEPRFSSREPSKSPEQKRTTRRAAKFEVQPIEAPTSGQKRRGRGAEPESEITKESNQKTRGRRAAAAATLKSQNIDEPTPEVSLQQQRRLSAEMGLPGQKRRGRVAAKAESQPTTVPNSSDQTRPGRAAAKSKSQMSPNQKKQNDGANLMFQPIAGSPDHKKRGRAAAELDHIVDDTLPPKRTKRGRVVAEVEGVAPDKSLGGGLAETHETVSPKVSKQNKSSTKRGTRTSSENQSPERVLLAASNQKSRRGRTVAKVVETRVPTTKTKVKSQTPSPRKTRSRK